MISVSHLTKHYQVHKRQPGIAQALRSLWKRQYESVRAVDDISFSIAPGERVGFLGPNGAGKTTTLKMLSGLLHPTSGEVSVLGHVPALRSREFLSSIMLVTGQKQQLIWDLPPAETFELNRAIYGLDRAVFKRTLDELVLALRIDDVMFKPTRQLSLGERMTCELAAALLHRPRVLFLDEPTIGLDVTMQGVVRGFIKRYNEETGASVLLTSHDMDDVAALCPRIIVIDHGRLIFDGTLSGLVEQQRPEKRVTLRFGEDVVAARLQGLGRVVDQAARSAVIQVPAGELRGVVQKAFAELPIVDLLAENAPLEEVLAELFAKSREARA
ncbi:MAG: ATP-binding cassette domain-containing protein [Deltaproteobacteria bacterium]|nr:ATP-binding cassette domain-containing protein [Deltaproteobacteria bacterium]